MKRKVWKKLVAMISATAMALPLFSSAAYGEVFPDAEVEEYSVNDAMKLWYETPANINTAESSGGEWMQQSLPLGNGNLGNLIFGGISKERIHFNEKTLWTGGPSSSRPNYQFGNKSTSYSAEEIEEYRQILDDKSRNVFNDAPGYFGNYGYTPIRFAGENNLNKGSYQDFGDIWLDYSKMGITDSNVSGYSRELDIQKGIATTEFIHDDVAYVRQHFVSSPDEVMVTYLTASEAGALDVGIQMELNNGNLAGTVSLDKSTNSCTIEGSVRDNGLKFLTKMTIVASGGTVTADTGKKSYQVTGADSIMILMAAETDYKNDYPVYRDLTKDLEQVVDTRLSDACAYSFDELKKNHLEDHQELFDRVVLDLNEDLSHIPTDQLMNEYRNGNYSKYLEVLAFQYGRYLSIAGSRGTLPSNLVGLWTVGDSAWTGDYHFNINVQMNYWPVYVTNLAECGTTMVEYMENLREPGRLTAERVHGIENAVEDHTGFVVHTENNPFGMTAPSNAQEYGWNPTGAAWAIQNLWAHYEFTQDEAYLEEVIYPIMKESALFWDQYLWTSSYQVINDDTSPYDGEPRLVVAPSFSEEQGPTAVGTTYDQSLVWELYKECIAAGEIVGEDPDLLDQWTENMQRLDPIEINSTNGIKEWYEETRVGTESGHHKSYAKAGNLPEIAVPNSGWNIGHPGEQRHASHLVGLYPGTLINKENEEVMDAAIQSLTERGEYSTGWSKANKINLWARTGDGDQAYVLLNHLIGGKSSGLQYNLFDSHGSGGGDTMMNGTPVWQIDGNYGLTAGVAEMLIQSHMGYTQFLPAVPEAWESGNVQGLKARGNFTIGQTWYKGMPEQFTVRYDGEEPRVEFTGEYENITDAKVYLNGKSITVTKDTENNRITFDTKPGETYVIDMGRAIVDDAKETAKEYIDEIHEDLHELKDELQTAVNKSSDSILTILKKAELMNELYQKVSDGLETVFWMTEKDGCTDSDIDKCFLSLNAICQVMLENSEDYEFYQSLKQGMDEFMPVLENIRDSREISFSQESGTVTNKRLTLSADEYEIRYTLDGSTPNKDSLLYSKAITLNSEGTTVVKAILYHEDQIVSPLFTKCYTTETIPVKEIELSHETDWGAEYTKDKMVDGNTSTRWASKAPDSSKDLELTFTLEGKQPVNQVSFDQFVSERNGIHGYEIQALVDGRFVTVYEGDKLGDINDKTGNYDQASGGYHAYALAEFDTVETDTVKVILKEGFVGEPSLFEVKFLYVPAEKLQGDFDAFNEEVEFYDAADRASGQYTGSDEMLKESFEESILLAKAKTEGEQNELDQLLWFIAQRYYRMKLDEVPRNPFADVESDDWYYAPVLWGTQNKVVNGLTANTFGPKENCTRAQIVTFIWRAEGEPLAENRNHSFKDVEEGKYYYEAMLWAVEQGIVTGRTTEEFAPNATCTRSEMVTLLWRHAGKEEPQSDSSPFTDIISTKWYYKAAIWSYENKVVNGHGDGTIFAPNNTITRSETVTMLYRYFTQK